MHKRLIEEGFNRRYVLLPMLLSIALVIAGYAVMEMRRAQARHLTLDIRDRQDVIRLLTEASYRAMEAESAQRGFLLTEDGKYLAPFDGGLDATRGRLAQLRDRYLALDATRLPVLDGISAALDSKAREMQQTVALQREGRRDQAMQLVKSNVGLDQMFAISQSLEALRERERQDVLSKLDAWNRATRINTFINTGNLVFTVLLLLVLGLLATRDIRRRNIFAAQLASQIDDRTAELRELSLHMSRVAENEKHALARELHDELGGLLVAMRMDINLIRRRLGVSTDPDVLARWERIDLALTQGMELKRRVIEDLRPTLLDNMGLFTALRWLASQSSEQAQLKLHMEGLDEDIQIPPETAIAVFRTAQEAIANVIRHARATTLEVKATVDDRLQLAISDDGIGVPDGADRRPGAHGLRQMRFRMEAVGGDIRIQPHAPRGTCIVLSVPLEPPPG